MHGQAKVISSEEEIERKRKEKEQKVHQYKTGMEKIFLKRKNGERDIEALALISDVLVGNPDVYTLWNFRKEILEALKFEKIAEELAKILTNELRLTEMCLKANPKSYCAWYHRLWLITNWPNPDLMTELSLCNKYLKLDERNFHCWDYRRAVTSLLGHQPSEELLYTLTKIEENFSNYSSWHYRSKLLPLIYPDPAGIRPVDEKNHLFELELVEHAAFTDPNDQSAWFYLRWLLGRLKPSLKPVIITARNGVRLCAAFNQSVMFCKQNDLKMDGIHAIIDGIPLSKWISLCYRKDTGIQSSKAWFSDLPAITGETIKVSFTYNDGHKEEVMLEKSKNYIWTSEPIFDSPFSPNLVNVLKQQLNTCNQLLQLEPESKWTLLTSAVLMQAIDKFNYKENIVERLNFLKKCDKLRANYYDDLRSKFLIECILQKWDLKSDKISFAKLDLTTLYHSQYLTGVVYLDLSNNRLERSLHDLYTLTECQELHLDKNNLMNLKGLPRLPSLKSLTLHGNKLSSVEDIVPYLSKHKSLERLVISNNPIATHGFGDLAIALPGVSIICDSHSDQL